VGSNPTPSAIQSVYLERIERKTSLFGPFRRQCVPGATELTAAAFGVANSQGGQGAQGFQEDVRATVANRDATRNTCAVTPAKSGLVFVIAVPASKVRTLLPPAEVHHKRASMSHGWHEAVLRVGELLPFG
jgi:hypothetical protein